MDQGSGLWQNLGDAPSEPECVSPDAGDTEEEEHFTIPASEVGILHQEYTEFINLKDNTEIVLAEAMEATERLNMVFSQIRTSMNRMSPHMKELFIVPSKKASGRMREPGNNQAHDKAAAKAATERIVAQVATMEPVPGTGTDDCGRNTCGNGYDSGSSLIFEDHFLPDDPSSSSSSPSLSPSQSPSSPPSPSSTVIPNSSLPIPPPTSVTIAEPPPTHDYPPPTRHLAQQLGEAHQSPSRIWKQFMEENLLYILVIGLCIVALSLDTNAQYWSNLSNKATRCSHRALELQLKLAEEKGNTLLHEEAPEEALLEAAREA
ncbi:hypothetical protein M422DRAFT_276743 [Sphaerobolus stellatus SS14]|uniref:Uncharacterized protein n=1 Tax=Sphaerobolus stellatus (strain SS14) TaxID=990650 RepID=A0A0C9UCH0_SPHS4|nr:hypothetical protein M422DRAFT_276743 [Sphaerobolus stellatus SS14]